MSSRTQTGGSAGGKGLSNPVLVGTVIIVTILVAVFLSYNANRGLPFVKTFDLTADVPDAAELVPGSEVRIGGFRVGQVNEIVAVPPTDDAAPYAKLTLALDGDVQALPQDTIVRIRPRSLLGAKYVELTPGGSAQELVSGDTLPLRQSRKVTEIDETFQTFDADTRQGLQGTIRGFGNALAGRGGDINRAIGATNRLLGPLRDVSRTLAAPETELDTFVTGLAATMAAVLPVTTDLADGLRDGAATLGALDRAGSALETFVGDLPATEVQATRGLLRISPVIRDLTDLAVALEPGVQRLPNTTRELTGALQAGTRTLRTTDRLTTPLRSVLTKLDAVTTDPASRRAVQNLGTTVTLLKPTVDDLTQAQVSCNAGTLAVTGLNGIIRRGDADGSWLSTQVMLDVGQQMHSREPAGNLHYNPYPVQNATECEAGNEPYAPGQVIGNTAGTQSATVPQTTPPGGALDRARSAGLLDPIEGGSG